MWKHDWGKQFQSSWILTFKYLIGAYNKKLTESVREKQSTKTIIKLKFANSKFEQGKGERKGKQAVPFFDWQRLGFPLTYSNRSNTVRCAAAETEGLTWKQAVPFFDWQRLRFPLTCSNCWNAVRRGQRYHKRDGEGGRRGKVWRGIGGGGERLEQEGFLFLYEREGRDFKIR